MNQIGQDSEARSLAQLFNGAQYRLQALKAERFGPDNPDFYVFADSVMPKGCKGAGLNIVLCNEEQSYVAHSQWQHINFIADLADRGKNRETC